MRVLVRCMVRPRLAAGVDGIHVWRVAENMLNKQLETAEQGQSFSSGVGWELTTYNCKEQYITKCYFGLRILRALFKGFRDQLSYC